MKISQLNHHLADVVESTSNAEYELQKYKRHIREDKYMWVYVSFVRTNWFTNDISALENFQTERTGHFTELWFGYLRNKMRFKQDQKRQFSKSDHLFVTSSEFNFLSQSRLQQNICSSPIATLAKAERKVKKMWSDELKFHWNLQIMYYEQNPRSIDIELIQVGNTDWRLELDRKNSAKDWDLIFC